MASFATNIWLEPPKLDAPNYGLAPRPLDAWQLATIEFSDSDIVGFVNKSAAIDGLPAGLSISPARIAPDGMKRPKREGDIESGVVPMQTARVKFQDKGRALSALVSNKRANGKGLRGKTLKLYEWEAGQPLDLDRHLVGTYRLDDRGWLDGYRSLSGLDIRRQLKETIFEAESYKLAESINSSDKTLTIDVPYDVTAKPLPFMEHDARYSSDPNETVMYIRLQSGEIVKLPKSDADYLSDTRVRFSSCKRGALNTLHLVEGVTVEPDTESDNLPELAEWIYLEETLPSLIRGITVGATFDGRAVPGHWTISMALKFLDVDSLLYSAPELAALPLRVENYGSTTVKDLIESEILPFLPASMQVNPRGMIGIRRITTIRDVGANQHVFDDSVVDRSTLAEVKTQVSHIKSSLGIRAGWDARTEKWASPIFFYDAATRAVNDATYDAEALILESKLLHSSIHTDAQIRRLLPALAEHYLGEKLLFSVKVLPSAAIVDVGDRVHVSIKDVPDDATLAAGAPDIDRSFLVVSVDAQADGTVYQFKGTSGLADDYYDLLTSPSLTDDDYLRNATPLTDDLPSGALIEIAGIYYLQPGTYPLSFRKKYVFMDGPLYHSVGSKIICESGEEGAMFSLWIPHAWHTDSLETVVTTGKGGRLGGQPGQPGHAGYSAPTIGAGSMIATGAYEVSDGAGTYNRRSWRIQSLPGVRHDTYSTGDSPAPSLSFNNDTLVGLPIDLSGYAGCGGGELEINTRSLSVGTTQKATYLGGVGAPNSAGVFIMCRGASASPESRFIVNGADGAVATSHMFAPSGGGSGPGTVMIGIDGPFSGPADLFAHVAAHPGETFYTGNQLPAPSVTGLKSLDRHSYYKALSHTENLAPICSRVIHVPARAKIQEKQLYGVDLAFQRQADNLIRLIRFTDTLPSSADPGDLAITYTELAGKSLTPSAWIRTNNDTWTEFDWVSDERATAYLQLVQSHRESGGLEYFNQEVRPTTFTPGSLWRQPSTRITYKLEKYGPPDEVAYADGAEVSDNRFLDPEFTELMIGGTDWVIRSDIYSLPKFSTSTPSVALSIRIIDVEFSGNLSLSVEPEYDLPGVSNVRGVVYSGASLELTFGTPPDMTGIEGFQVRRDGALVGEIPASGPYSFVDTGLAAGTAYTYTIRSVAGGERSPDSTPYTLTTNGAVSEGSTLNPVTNLTVSVYSGTALELHWSPPAPPGDAAGYEIRRFGYRIATLSGISTNSYFDSGLLPNTAYDYDVRVIGGDGARSDDVRVSPRTNA